MGRGFLPILRFEGFQEGTTVKFSKRFQPIALKMLSLGWKIIENCVIFQPIQY